VADLVNYKKYYLLKPLLNFKEKSYLPFLKGRTKRGIIFNELEKPAVAIIKSPLTYSKKE